MRNFKRGLVEDIKKEISPVVTVKKDNQQEEYAIAEVFSKFLNGFMYLITKLFLISMIVLSSIAVTALIHPNIRLIIINMLKKMGGI